MTIKIYIMCKVVGSLYCNHKKISWGKDYKKLKKLVAMGTVILTYYSNDWKQNDE